MKSITCWTLLTTLALSTGCANLGKDWKSKLPWLSASKIKSSAYGAPAKMVAIWTPDILAQPGKPATRGFGGRIYFYNDKSQSIPVEGQLVVYAYDDTIDPQHAGQPQRKYAFTPEQFTQHYSASELGASYSIWLPWDAVGGEQRNISLVPVFTASSGQIVMGQQAANMLPGVKGASPGPMEPHQSQVAYLAKPDIQQVTHRQAGSQVDPAAFAGATSAASAESRIRTSTIRLTPSLQRRVAEQKNLPNPPATNPPGPGVPSPAVPQLPANPIALPPHPTQAAVSAAEGAAVEPLAHSALHQFRVRGGPTGRPVPPAPATPPNPAAPPSAPQSASLLPSSTANPGAW